MCVITLKSIVVNGIATETALPSTQGEEKKDEGRYVRATT
jgi:hypothetical protein